MAQYEFPENQGKRIALALREFQPCPVLELGIRYKLDRWIPPRADFPVPELVLFTLRDLMDFEWAGTDEKERWSVYAIFRNALLVFAMAKFGFEVEFTAGMKSEVSIALGRLKKATEYAEEGLRQFGTLQLHQGNVTIANRIYYFDNRYRYFRRKADEAYNLAERDRQKARRRQGTHIGGIAPPDMEVTWAGMRRDQEGSFCSAAMMDAFFSRLEHELTLILAFTDFDPANGALNKFFKEQWGPKFKQVFDLAKDKRADTLYQKLFQVKERWRNPLAHGGYEKDWSSVYFHLPGIGPIPGSSRAYGNSVEFNLHPVEPADHKTVCQVFDEVDKLFDESYVKEAHNYVNAGFDIAFDEQSRTYIKQYVVAGATAALIDAEDELRCLDGDMCLEVDHPERLRFVSQPLTKFWR